MKKRAFKESRAFKERKESRAFKERRKDEKVGF